MAVVEVVNKVIFWIYFKSRTRMEYKERTDG